MIITDEKQITNLMNEYFINITKKLNSQQTVFSIDSDSNLDWFHNHTSITKVKEIYPQIVPNSFKF